MDATIIVATYGSRDWLNKGNKTATYLSVIDQPIVRLHGGNTLAQCRNAAAALAETEWLCFIDAGDTVALSYFDDMEGHDGDLLAPRLFFDIGGAITEPFDLTNRNMDYGNQCCIGTLIRKGMFDAVGGFWEEPAYEDWSLFRRAWLLGAQIEHVDTKYVAEADQFGRNNMVDDPIKLIRQIRDSHREWHDNFTHND